MIQVSGMETLPTHCLWPLILSVSIICARNESKRVRVSRMEIRRNTHDRLTECSRLLIGANRPELT